MAKVNKKAVKNRRKNFLPTVLINIVLWGINIFIVTQIDPNLVRDILIPDSHIIFLVFFFFALFLSASLILGNSRRGLLVSSFMTIFLSLRLHGLGNMINGILLAALLLTIEIYALQTKPR